MTNFEHPGLSEEEAALTAEMLDRLKPGFLPFRIFQQMARLAVSSIVELVPLRRGPEGEGEILLISREDDDPVWPGQLHVPGTVVRATDTPGCFDSAFERIFRELNGVDMSEPEFVKPLLHHSGRGMESSHIHVAEVTGRPTIGEFYPWDELPENTVESQLDFIPDAVEHFKKRES